MKALRGLYSIPADLPFAASFARGVLEAYGADPLALARVTIYLPTRRALRSLQDAFLRASAGRALVLPRLLPLGDLAAEDQTPGAWPEAAAAPAVPAAMPSVERLCLLAQLVTRWQSARGLLPDDAGITGQNLRLAAELARLLDQVETEGLAFDALGGLVPESLAAHWQDVLDFLDIVATAWPEIEAEAGMIGPARRHRLQAAAQVAQWRDQPPADPVIVAGSTGSIPATRELIGAVLELAEGVVVLPGLDLESDDATWAAIREDPAHYQHGLALLLEHIGQGRDRVARWPGAGDPGQTPALQRFLGRALAPVATTGQWHQAAAELSESALAESLRRVTCIDCPGSGEEALVVALLLREVLESPERTAALVTPDRDIARRVAAEMRRWDIAIDDSAGEPLKHRPLGAFFRLLAEALCGEGGPLALLSLLKHPLARGGTTAADFRGKVRRLELAVLRGPRPAPGPAGLAEALENHPEAAGLLPWLADIEDRLSPFRQVLDGGPAPLETLVQAHTAAAEALAESEAESGGERLWSGDDGEALAGFIAELLRPLDRPFVLDRVNYPAAFDQLLEGQVVRPRYGRHPRLMILGPLEARLQSADRVILAGLNEGIWPVPGDPGPWLSRPMMARFGLALPERRIGLSAHDFVQAFSAEEIFLTRSERVAGTPTVPSRWLLRLKALAQALELEIPGTAGGTHDLRGWAEALDRPAGVAPRPAPRPCPPLKARPRKLSVTRIQHWLEDPYGFYARSILRLKPLDPLDADPGAAERGSMIHAALETFARRHPVELPDDPLSELLKAGQEAFAALHDRPGLWAFWWPRFERIAQWVALREAEERPGIQRVAAEVEGLLEIATVPAPFHLTAKADRVDLLTGGDLRILDYKTGQPPSDKAVREGTACQLPLEAAIAGAGGFEGVPAGAVAALAFWRLSGGRSAGEPRELKDEPAELAALWLARLSALIEAYDNPAQPYHVRPRPRWAPRFDDYQHLARLKEWAPGSEGAPS